VTTGVQLDKSSRNATPTPGRTRRLFLVVSLLLLLALAVVWWTTSGQEFVLETVHPFRVTQIKTSAGTMSLVHGQRTYVVRCDTHCTDFRPSSTYPMKDIGDAVEYSGAGQKIDFPILEEQITFDTTGGHG
jgi:hypothetical protein